MSDLIWPIAFLVALFVVIGLSFRKVIKRRDQRLPQEKGLIPLHAEIAGGRFSQANFTAPFVRVFLYDDFIVISTWNAYLLEYGLIERLEVRRHVFSKGLHIRHKKVGLPSIIIWSSNCDYLKTRIQRQMSVHV